MNLSKRQINAWTFVAPSLILTLVLEYIRSFGL